MQLASSKKEQKNNENVTHTHGLQLDKTINVILHLDNSHLSSHEYNQPQKDTLKNSHLKLPC